MKIFLALFLLIFTLSCSTRNIKYDRDKLLGKYSEDYKMFVDNQTIDLEYIYLDKDNIENVQIDKNSYELKITQLRSTELFEMKNLNLDSLSVGRRGLDKKIIDLIVIDGIPLSDSLKDKLKIDPNAIKSLTILSQEKINNMNLCRGYNGDVLLITTK